MTYNYVMTVKGPVENVRLGITNVHEHLIVKPQLPDAKYDAYTLDNEEASLKEVQSFANAGGNTIVEMTPINYGRNPEALRRISEATGVNIICCTGYHKQVFLPDWFENKTDSELYDILMDDVMNGLDSTGIKPGVIKFGTSLTEITRSEQRAMEAVARVHKDTGLPISTHCEKGRLGMEQLAALERLGVDPAHVLLCHIDSAEDVAYAKDLCREGANIAFDHVGRELADHDALRVHMLEELVDAGFVDQVMIADDMGKKDYFCSYGGRPGLTYILTDLKQELLKVMTADDLKKIYVLNPQRFFSYF